MCLIFVFDVVRKPITECFGCSAEYGLSHLEIDLIRESSFIETFDSERISNLRNLSEEFGITESAYALQYESF